MVERSASSGRFVGMRRLRLAMAMQREGTEMMRRNLRRKHPEASEAGLDALLDEWLLSREPDAPGRCIAWPARRARSALATPEMSTWPSASMATKMPNG